jgi:cell division protein FtsN
MRFKAFPLKSIFLVMIFMMFLFGVYKMFLQIGDLKSPTNDMVEVSPLPARSEKSEKSITERDQSAKEDFARQKIYDNSRPEPAPVNKDKRSENLTVYSYHIDLPERPPIPTEESPNSDDLDQAKPVTNLDEHLKGSYYSVHFGSYKNFSNAKEKVELLAGKELQAWWKKVDVDGKGEWFRVYIGKYETKPEALSISKRLTTSGINGNFYVHKLGPLD